jgi:hypothetical protein
VKQKSPVDQILTAVISTLLLLLFGLIAIGGLTWVAIWVWSQVAAL